jgi:hypothetical protein
MSSARAVAHASWEVITTAFTAAGNRVGQSIPAVEEMRRSVDRPHAKSFLSPNAHYWNHAVSHFPQQISLSRHAATADRSVG